MKHIEALIAKGAPIQIVSGEGEIGTVEPYHGKRTLRAIRLRLTRERCGGDRWARARVLSHETPMGGEAWLDIESGEYA